VVLGVAAAAYAGVFAVFVAFEHSGLGLGHFFYVPICLVALGSDAVRGAAAGMLAAGLYAAAVIAAPGVPAANVLTESTAIRLFTYTLVGALVGRYASSNRMLVARLRDHATHDFLTGLGNARVFDEELAKRCASERPFTLVLTDVDDLKRVNDAHGHEEGNAALRRVAEALRENTAPGDCIARIGGDEFAILTGLALEQTALLCARISRSLAADELHLSFGTTASPQDGAAAVELFRKADDRLFAAKLLSRNRKTVLYAAKS
jgi:diguanylate cyclase (GGDEF)-like protein